MKFAFTLVSIVSMILATGYCRGQGKPTGGCFVAGTINSRTPGSTAGFDMETGATYTVQTNLETFFRDNEYGTLAFLKDGSSIASFSLTVNFHESVYNIGVSTAGFLPGEYVMGLLFCGDTIGRKNVTIAAPVGLTARPVTPEVRIFPNPCAHLLNIDLTGIYNLITSVSLTNAMGVTLKTISGPLNDKVLELDVQPFPTGLYFLNIRSNASTEIRKVIVNH